MRIASGAASRQRTESPFRAGKNLGIPTEESGVASQLDKDGNLRPKDLRADGFEEEIDGAQIVSAKQVIVAAEAGQKENWRSLGLLAIADQAGSFEPVHSWHLHIEQYGREIHLQQVAKRSFAGLRQHKFIHQVLKGRLERQQVPLVVVDQQEPRLRGLRRFRAISGGGGWNLLRHGCHISYRPLRRSF